MIKKFARVVFLVMLLVSVLSVHNSVDIIVSNIEIKQVFAKRRRNKKKERREREKRRRNQEEKRKEKAQKKKHQDKLDEKVRRKRAAKIVCAETSAAERRKYKNTKYEYKSRCKVTNGNGGPMKRCSASQGGKKVMCGGANCSKVIAADCSNAARYCPPDSCSCTATSCKPGTPANKFRQKATGSGLRITCNGCVASRVACDPIYTNSIPTCNIAPGSISTTRMEDPKSFVMSVSDKDDGDTVKVVGVKVVDAHGNLKSCVNVTTPSGGSVDNMIVKTGSNTPSDTTQKTTFMVDARSAYGVYEDIGRGVSRCSGDLVIELADVDSDGNGLDRSDHTTCKLSVSVTNNNPTVSNIRVEDRDINPTLRRTGNLATQYAGVSNNLPVGSLFDSRRVSSCSSAITINGSTGDCPKANWIPRKTHTNPYSIAFRVSDNEGIRDIKDIGFWKCKTKYSRINWTA